MPNVHLITFADGSQDYREAGARLIASSNAFDCIDFRRSFSQKDLGPDYADLYAEKVRLAPIGLGYFSWKPYLVSTYLSKMDDHDVLVYIDSGCELNHKGLPRFHDYLSMTSNHGALSFELAHPFRYWTKKHLLLTEAYPQHHYRNMLVGGIFFLQKNSHSLKFALDWLNLSSFKGGETLIDPEPGEVQIKGFRAHRHDQSTLSAAAFNNHLHKIKDETYFPYWSDGLQHPILAVRNRTGSATIDKKLSLKAKIKDTIRKFRKNLRQLNS